jgi:hypothetical protein
MQGEGQNSLIFFLICGFKHCTVDSLHFVGFKFSWRGVLDTTSCDQVCQWCFPDTPVFSTNKGPLQEQFLYPLNEY